MSGFRVDIVLRNSEYKEFKLQFAKLSGWYFPVCPKRKIIHPKRKILLFWR